LVRFQACFSKNWQRVHRVWWANAPAIRSINRLKRHFAACWTKNARFSAWFQSPELALTNLFSRAKKEKDWEEI
jgi:hypothetical protein